MKGDLVVKPLIKGDEMTLLEIHYQPGVGAPLHIHAHESLAYVVKGKVKMTVGKEVYILGPGDVCRHPEGVPWRRRLRRIDRRRNQVPCPGHCNILGNLKLSSIEERSSASWRETQST